MVENSEWILCRMEEASLARGRVGMCCTFIFPGAGIGTPLDELLLLEAAAAAAAVDDLLLDGSALLGGELLVMSLSV